MGPNWLQVNLRLLALHYVYITYSIKVTQPRRQLNQAVQCLYYSNQQTHESLNDSVIKHSPTGRKDRNKNLNFAIKDFVLKCHTDFTLILNLETKF